ncbi:CKLF-like MARVEL transmembrane domain-containing protein 4 [Ptychodera flava]|uniref:CKLF-like MARVEL transmembrane domain-containing protein 4 n=1 Tax=Ptychodera flava TaxID=63121 RepID=UPI003969ED6B
METTTTTVTTTSSTRIQPSITCDVLYVRTVRGILKIVQCVISLIAFICITAAKWWTNHYSAYRFHQFVTMFCFWSTLILIVLYMTKLILRIPLPWILIEFFYCCGACVFYLISSSCVAAYSYGYAAHEAAAVFGFFALIVYGIEAFFLFRDWRGGVRSPEGGAPVEAHTTSHTVTETKQEPPPAYDP